MPAAAALLALLTVGVFFPAVRHEFSAFDDAGYITRNRMVARGLTPGGVRWALTATEMANWHPLTWFSHMLDVELFGMNPGAHHAVSVAIHAANAVLLFLVLRGISGALWRSAFVAALFAVHPLHVESVAFAAERKDVLSTLFALLSLLAWLAHLRRPARVRPAASWGSFALALLAKPMPVTLPFVMLLLDFWPLGRWAPSRAGALGLGRLVREKAPFFGLAALSCAVTWVVQSRGGAVAPIADIGLTLRLENAALAAMQYLQTTAWPRGLAFFYPHPLEISWWRWAAALLLLAAVTLLALRSWRSRPWLGCGWLWYLGMLVPVIGLVQVGSQARADRYTYLPLVGIFIALSWELAARLTRRSGSRAPASLAACLLLVALAVATRSQLAHWRDAETLCRRALAVTGENPVVSAQLGVVLLRKGSYGEAEEQLRRSLAAQPGNAVAHNNLAIVLDRSGRGDEAVREYRAALAIAPGYAEAQLNLGTLHLRRGELQEALVLYRGAVEAEPELPAARFNLALALEASGRWEEAVGQYETAIRMGIPGAVARTRLGVLLARGGRRAEAVRELEEALRLDPGDREAAGLLERLGREQPR